MKFLKAFGRYWYDFIIGDDWKIAAAVLSALLALFIIEKNNVISGWWLSIAGATLIMSFFSISLIIDVRSKSR